MADGAVQALVRTSGQEWVDREAFPWAPRFQAVPGGRLHYVDEGQGETLLFIHGTPTWAFEWRHLMRAFAPTHRCIAVDHLGFGLSERPADASYTPEAHAERLRAFVHALGLRDVTLVLHDFGGPIGFPLLFERGVVRRLVVLNSFAWPIDDPKTVRAAKLLGGGLGRFLYRRFNLSPRVILPSAYGDRRKLTKAIHRQYLAPWPDADGRERVLFALAKALLASEPFYRSLHARRDVLRGLPIHLVWGLRDPAFPQAYLTRWQELAPHASTETITAAGHWPHEEAPAEVEASLRRFLAA